MLVPCSTVDEVLLGSSVWVLWDFLRNMDLKARLAVSIASGAGVLVSVMTLHKV